MYVPTRIKQFASAHETSDEVALAIFELAHEGGEEGGEERLWEDPSEEEILVVMGLAWSYARDDVDVLHWGNESHKRL